MGELIWIGWIIAAVGVGLASLRNRRLNKQLGRSQASVEQLTADLATARAEVAGIPKQVFALIEDVLTPPTDGRVLDDDVRAALPARVWAQDVTGRGWRELLIEQDAGVTDTVLKILGKSGSMGVFEIIGEMVTDEGPFIVGDVDGDGQVEVRAIMTERKTLEGLSGGPLAPVVEAIWRWNGSEFDVSHGERWDRMPGTDDPPDWYAAPGTGPTGRP